MKDVNDHTGRHLSSAKWSWESHEGFRVLYSGQLLNLLAILDRTKVCVNLLVSVSIISINKLHLYEVLPRHVISFPCMLTLATASQLIIREGEHGSLSPSQSKILAA